MRRKTAMAGFTVLEMALAMGIFSVIAAAAFGLMSQSQPLFNQQQGLAAVNIAIRNTTAQMQLDITNGGSNFYSTVNVPNWPVGIVIVNNTPASNCETSTTTWVYGSSCFDTMNIIASDPNSGTVTNPGDSSIGGCHLTTSTSVYLSPPTASPSGSGYPTLAAATAAAALFHYNAGVNPDQLLFVRGDGSQYTTAVLTANPTAVTVSGRFYLKLTHGATNANGTNASTTNDPLQITVNQDTAAGTYQNTMLGTSFCSGSPTTDFVLRLTPVQYSVDTSNSADPQLVRTQNGTTQVLADQVIGFKVGATLFNGGTGTDSTAYDFKNSDYLNNYTLVRSVRISLIGRTVPVSDPTYHFRNTFDGGPYLIQGVSVIVNPRNMSMSDN